MERCRADCAYWLNTYGKTYDPRLTDPNVPFHIFPRQAEYLTWLRERETVAEGGIVEKSRDMGVTWLCCAYALHGWLFREGFSCGFGSRKLELVDKIGDPNSIFEKLRFLLRYLPGWMLPAGFDWSRHDNYCKLLNPANGSTITGEGGDNIGRGGRASIYFVDEAAFLEHPGKAEASLSQTTNVRIDVSTPNGPGNAFATKRHNGRWQVFTFHWRDDPRKGDVWYQRQKETLDPVTLAQEVDIDYTASVEGICIPAAWVRAAVDLFKHPRFTAAYPQYKTAGEVVAGLDIAEEGTNKSVFQARQGAYIHTPIAWGQMNTTQTAHRARDEAAKAKAVAVYYDVVGVGAGVRGSFESTDRPLMFKAYAVNWGLPPTDDRWPDGKTSKELFVNLRAELAWKLRRRFERAYEFIENGVPHAPEDMISIPNVRELIADLSLELYFRTETGKIQLESKKDMQRRGVKSPDYKDALAFSFAPKRGEVVVMLKGKRF